MDEYLLIVKYNNRLANDAAFPSFLPSINDSPEYPHVSKHIKADVRQDSPMGGLGPGDNSEEALDNNDIRTSFAPLGYVSRFSSVMLIPKLHMNKLCIMQTFWAEQHIAYKFSAQTYNPYMQKRYRLAAKSLRLGLAKASYVTSRDVT